MRKLITIITPCLNEEETARTCYETVKKLFAEKLPGYDYEHIFCDNCSTDRTAQVLRELAEEDKNVRVILNSRNFGSYASIFNGMRSARGDAVLPFLPADLQDPAEIIVDFVRKWEEGYQVVRGVRKKREESLLMATGRRIYYRVVNKLADTPIPPDVGEFQFLDRVVVDYLLQFEDYYPYVRGMIASCGFEATSVEYTWVKRKKGKTKTNMYRLVDEGLNGMISFSRVPLRIAMFIGFFIATLSIGYSLVAFALGLIYYRTIAPPGIPTLITALFFFSGVQLFFLGFMGEYISAIHSQVRKKPLVMEKARFNFTTPQIAQKSNGTNEKLSENNDVQEK